MKSKWALECACLSFLQCENEKNQCFSSPSGLRFKTKLDSQRYLFFFSSFVFLFYKTKRRMLCASVIHIMSTFSCLFSVQLIHWMEKFDVWTGQNVSKRHLQCRKKAERRQYVREQKKNNKWEFQNWNPPHFAHFTLKVRTPAIRHATLVVSFAFKMFFASFSFRLPCVRCTLHTSIYVSY